MIKFFIILISFALLSSCAHKRKITNTESTPYYSKLKSICLNGEGKGRVRFQNSRKLFSYESINDYQEKKWRVALHLPIIGEKLLSINWGREKSGRLSVKGSFIGAMFRELKKSKNGRLQSKNLKNALHNFAKTISFLSTVSESEVANCKRGEGHILCSKKLTRLKIIKGDDKLTLIPFSNNENQSYKVVVTNDSQGHYSRISVLPIVTTGYNDSKPFSLDLFVKGCSS